MITVDSNTFVSYSDDDDYADEGGGAVLIYCDCGHTGYVDVDADGIYLTGECDECGAEFTVKY